MSHGSGNGIFYTLVSLYGIFIIFGVLGNCLIVLAVLLRERMRTARNVFILTLAVSDIFLCVIAMPSTLWEVSAQNCITTINFMALKPYAYHISILDLIFLFRYYIKNGQLAMTPNGFVEQQGHARQVPLSCLHWLLPL